MQILVNVATSNGQPTAIRLDSTTRTATLVDAQTGATLGDPQPLTADQATTLDQAVGERQQARNATTVATALDQAISSNQATIGAIDDPAGAVQTYLATPDGQTIVVPANSTATTIAGLMADLNALKNWTASQLQAVEDRRAADRRAIKWMFRNVANVVLRQITGLARLWRGGAQLDSTAGT